MMSLKELSDVASALNKESDNLSNTLRELQDRINETNIGLEVWLDDYLLVKEDESLNPDTERLSWSEWRLGYCRLGDEWSLAVKRVTVEKDQNDNESDLDSDEPISLLKASRHIRMEALGILDCLVTALTNKAKRTLRNIENAKQLAKKIKA